MPTETMPGTEIGTRMRHSAVMEPAPSTRTASSSSFGSVLKYPVIMMIAYGSVNTM